MKAQIQKETVFKQCARIYHHLETKEPLRMLLVVVFPVLIILLMKRNDLSLKEDLARLSIFTTCTAVWWYVTIQKRSRHAQLRKPLLLESPPEKL